MPSWCTVGWDIPRWDIPWTMPECIYQFIFSEVHPGFYKLLMSFPLKTNLEILHMDAKLLGLGWCPGIQNFTLFCCTTSRLRVTGYFEISALNDPQSDFSDYKVKRIPYVVVSNCPRGSKWHRILQGTNYQFIYVYVGAWCDRVPNLQRLCNFLSSHSHKIPWSNFCVDY